MEFIRKTEPRRNTNGRKTLYGIFRCECGKEEEKSMSNGKRQIHCMECGNKEIGKKSKTRQTKHGGRYTLLYGVWKGIRARCHKKYKRLDVMNYQDRGIIVCDEWRNNFEPFREWALANGYKKGLTIDRINNDGNYEPDNCRWTTSSEQMRNTRYNVLTKEIADEIIEYKKNHTMTETAKHFDDKVNSKNIRSLVNNVINGGQWK